MNWQGSKPCPRRIGSGLPGPVRFAFEGRPPSNVSYNLKKLVELGFLDHQRSRVDRRSVRIRLTAQGQEIRKIVDALYQKHVKTVEQVGGISNEEFATLNKSLHRLERDRKSTRLNSSHRP